MPTQPYNACMPEKSTSAAEELSQPRSGRVGSDRMNNPVHYGGNLSVADLG